MEETPLVRLNGRDIFPSQKEEINRLFFAYVVAILSPLFIAIALLLHY